MERNVVLRLIAFIFILAGVVSLDLVLPGKESEVKVLDSFYSSLTKTYTTRRPAYELRHIVELSDGETYRIGILPDKEYAKGAKIKIVKSALFNNVNKVLIFDQTWKIIPVGLLSNTLIFSLFLAAISVAGLNLLVTKKGLMLLLVAASMFMGIVTFLYIAYY